MDHGDVMMYPKLFEFVEDGESCKVSDLQLWGRRLIIPPCSDQSGMGYDSKYFLGLGSSVGHLSEADGLENLILTPNNKKWFFASDASTRDLGLDRGCILRHSDQ